MNTTLIVDKNRHFNFMVHIFDAAKMGCYLTGVNGILTDFLGVF